MKQLTVLITRPEEDAHKTATLLEHKGFHVLIEPMMHIVITESVHDEVKAWVEKRPQAILVTSANGVRALARFTEIRNTKILAVGGASAHEAEKAGFTRVVSAHGDVHILAQLVLSECEPNKGFLLHVAGTVLAGDLKRILEQEGAFEVVRIAAYNAIAVERFTPELLKALQEKKLDIALFYSARTLAIFDELIEKEQKAYLLKDIELFVLSDAITSKHIWKNRIVAPVPEEGALLELIERVKCCNTGNQKS